MTKTIYKQWYIQLTLAFGAFLFIAFFITTFGNIDRWFADVMGEWIKVEFIKFWVVFYNEAGWSCLFLLIAVCLIILNESWYFKYHGTKKTEVFYFVNYSIILLAFFAINITSVASSFNEDTGWGPGIDTEYLTNNTYKIISRFIIFAIETSMLVFTIYFLRAKAIKSNILMDQRAWVIAVSAIIFIALIYLFLVLTLKQSFGRPYYLNVEFERYIGKVQLDETGWAIDIELTPEVAKMEEQFPDLKDRILESYNNSNYWTQADRYYKWYEVNGNWYQNLRYWYGIGWLTWMFDFDPDYVKPLCFSNRDFPSGHTIASFTGIYYALFASVLISDEKKRVRVTNTLFTIWFIHEFLMINLLVVARTHYVSDTWFSFAACAGFLVLSLRVTNTWMAKIVLKKRVKLGLLNEIEIINHRIYVYFQNDNKIFVGKTTGKKIEKSLTKYLDKQQVGKVRLEGT